MSALSDLIDLFSKLPGLGPRSARRIVLYLLKNKERIIPNITEMLENLKTSAIFCQICGNIDTSSPCGICSEKNRKSEKVCVVEDIGDLWAIEKMLFFTFLYLFHVTCWIVQRGDAHYVNATRQRSFLFFSAPARIRKTLGKNFLLPEARTNNSNASAFSVSSILMIIHRV